MQYDDSHEAQKKFANAKSISSAQYFGDQDKSSDIGNAGRLEKFAVSLLCNSTNPAGQQQPMLCQHSDFAG